MLKMNWVMNTGRSSGWRKTNAAPSLISCSGWRRAAGRARGLVNARKQHHGDHGQRRGEAEGRCRAYPSHQHAAQCRTAGEGHRARQLDPRVGGGQRLRRHQRRHQRRRRHAVGDGAAYGDEAEQREQGQRQQAEPDQGRIAISAAARNASAPAISRRREMRSASKPAGIANSTNGNVSAVCSRPVWPSPTPSSKHRDDRRRRQRDLFSRLRRQIGPGQPVEGGRAGGAYWSRSWLGFPGNR